MREETTVLTSEEARRVIAYLCIKLSWESFDSFPEDMLDQAIKEVREGNAVFYDRFSKNLDISTNVD